MPYPAGQDEDQTIHVDAEHLYEHSHLPPHYLVMFLPARRGAEVATMMMVPAASLRLRSAKRLLPSVLTGTMRHNVSPETAKRLLN